MTAGMLAGFAGIVSAGSAEGERDLARDALTGAAIMTSHILLDRTPIPPYFRSNSTTPLGRRIRNEIVNVLIDTVVYGYIAWRLWPREQDAAARAT